MKKTLLLSVVASTMIMAGGDIAPVEPVVEAPVAEATGWEFGGTGVVYYQTNDTLDISGAGPVGDLFDQASSAADAGIQLRATNADLFAGIGAGVEVNGLATLNLEHWMVSNIMQNVHGNLSGGWVSQSYLTYGFGNTSIKAGRQTLPKALSPMAYSDNWNVFANTFDALLIVNTDIENTTLVGAWVSGLNTNGQGADMADFSNINEHDGVYMLTAQNKSIADLTLTGTVYYAADYSTAGDTTILWGDAAYNAGAFNIAVQGANFNFDTGTDASLYGVKVGTEVSGINLAAAYSSVEDTFAHAFGTSTSAVYTTTALDQVKPAASTWTNEDKYLVSASTAALGGNLTGVYANSENDHSDYNEFDVVYSTNLTDSVNLTAAYVYADLDALSDTLNLVRVVGTYKF